MWYEHLRKCQKLRMQLWGHSIAILSLFNYAGFMFLHLFPSASDAFPFTIACCRDDEASVQPGAYVDTRLLPQLNAQIDRPWPEPSLVLNVMLDDCL